MRATTARLTAVSLGLALTLATTIACGPAAAKSVYLISRTDTSPTPVAAYDLLPAPAHLALQYQTSMPRVGTAATVLAVDATTNRLLIANSGTPQLQVMNPITLRAVGTVTATGMTEIAALVIDGPRGRVYALESDTNRLFVYAWDPLTPALTPDGGGSRSLQDVALGRALALDAERGRLYVGDRSSLLVRYYDTGTFALAGSVDLTPTGQTVTTLAVDAVRNRIYAGNGDPATGSLSRVVMFDIGASTGVFRELPAPAAGDHVVSMAFDSDRAQLYLTTRNSDTLLAMDGQLSSVLKGDLGDLGEPGPVAIASGPIGYNLMNFALVQDAGRPAPQFADLRAVLPQRVRGGCRQCADRAHAARRPDLRVGQWTGHARRPSGGMDSGERRGRCAARVPSDDGAGGCRRHGGHGAADLGDADGGPGRHRDADEPAARAGRRAAASAAGLLRAAALLQSLLLQSLSSVAPPLVVSTAT